MNREERRKELDDAIAKVVGELEASMAEGHSEDFIKSLEWWSGFRDYSWSNSLLILGQNPRATTVAGFRNWEKSGFHIRKGEVAIWILGPYLKKQENPKTGKEEQRLLGFHPVPVFDVSQCQEYPEKKPPQPFRPATGADWDHLYTCWVRRLETLFDIRVHEHRMGNLTYGAALKNRIFINSTFEADVKAPVLLHELSHVVAKHPTKDGHEKWSLKERELQAEASTFVLCRMLGANNPHSIDYLLNYRVEPGTLRDHIDEISSIVRQVRDILDFKHLVQEPAAIEAA